MIHAIDTDDYSSSDKDMKEVPKRKAIAEVEKRCCSQKINVISRATKSKKPETPSHCQLKTQFQKGAMECRCSRYLLKYAAIAQVGSTSLQQDADNLQ